MPISGIGATVSVYGATSTAGAARTAQTDQVNQILERLEMQRIMRAGVAVRESIQTLQETLNSSSGNTFQSATPTARSSAQFSLDPAATAAVLRSSIQINTETTDYTPTNPTWTGTSTANPVLTGLYDGSNGAGSLTFTVTSQGRRGASDATIRVTGPGDELIVDIIVDRDDPIDQQYALGNGLFVRFDGDRWRRDDTATSTLLTNVNQQADPDIAFDADPNFEYGVSVGAGSFEINGEVITVDADDSINTVLGKINTSDANVTATYDATNERVVLTQRTTGATPTITVGNDTSGFLVATRLNDAIVEPGTDPDVNAPIATVPNLGSIVAGDVLINGETVAIDPATQSVQQALDAINSSGAGVTARLIRDAYLVITSNSSSSVTLDSNGTNFFEAFNIESAEYAGTEGGNGTSSGTLNRAFADTRELTRALNNLFDAPAYAPRFEVLASLRGQTASLLSDSLDALRSAGVNLNLRIETSVKPFEAKLYDQTGVSFRSALRWRYDEFRNELVGTDDARQNGLLGKLLETLQRGLLDQYRPGALLDTLV